MVHVEPIKWLDDKEKNEEIFTNSECLMYCLKHFKEERRVEIWDLKKGYFKICTTNAEAMYEYEMIKTLSYEKIMYYANKNFNLKKDF